MPKFSVIIPTYNRASWIGKAIQSLLAQSFKDFEIIVVDDGSSDGTRTVLKPFENRIRYYYQDNQGAAAARNYGIRQAKGAYLAFTDDDIIADPRWLQEIDACFGQNQCDGVGGRVLPIFPEGTPPWAKTNPKKISGGVVIYDEGLKTFVYDLSYFRFISANFAFRKELFESCGLFREDLIFNNRIHIGEDTEIVERFMKQQKKLFYCGTALVQHPVYLNRLTLKHAARWNTALGGYAALREKEEGAQGLPLWGAVPRYLWKELVKNALRFVPGSFDALGRYDACRRFFRTWGMIQEYRRMGKAGQI